MVICTCLQVHTTGYLRLGYAEYQLPLPFQTGGDGNEPDVVEDESDMDLTDLDLNIESESDIMDSDGSESVR